MSGTVQNPTRDRFLGMSIRPLTRRRLDNFAANRRGFWSLWIFLVLFVLSLFAELIANDRPILIHYDGATYAPFLNVYAESEFGGLLDRVDGEVVILVPLARVGSDVVGGEPLRHVLDRELVV